MNLRTKPTGHYVWIVTTDDLDALWLRFREMLSPDFHEFDLQYRDAFSGVVDRLLSALALAGWLEEERGAIQVLNNVCTHKATGWCTNAAKLTSVTLARLRCTDEVRVACKAGGGGYYHQKYTTPMLVSYVWLKQIGQLRGLSR